VVRQRRGVRDYSVHSMKRWMDFWWTDAPARAARLTGAFGIVLRDGHYLRAITPVAAVAPAAAIAVGFIAGWRHPLATDVYTTSLFLMAIGLVVGTLSSAVGAWLLAGYAVGDIFLGVRDAAFNGAIGNLAKTWAALLLADAILAILIVLIPLTARVLADELAQRYLARAGRIPAALLAAVAAAGLAFAWTQAALVLTRPFFAWHSLSPTSTELDALHAAAFVLPLLAAAGTLLRVFAEEELEPREPPLPELPERAHRKVPLPLGIAWRVGLSVFLLAGLMESWIDPIVVAVVMAMLIALREPALRRLGQNLHLMMRFPVLPRLLLGAVVSAIIGIILVSALGTVSVIRPVVISTLVSLIVFSIVLPDHVLSEHVPESHDALGHPHPTGAVPVTAPPAPPPLP